MYDALRCLAHSECVSLFTVSSTSGGGTSDAMII